MLVLIDVLAMVCVAAMAMLVVTGIFAFLDEFVWG